MRGRLIFPFLADLRRVDPASTARSPGFDEDFREPKPVDLDGDGLDDRLRRELPRVMLPCQIEPKVFEQTQMLAGGDSPRSELSLVCHFRDLERLGLVDESTGEPLIQPNDRLAAIHDLSGRLVQRIRTPPGLYVEQALARGFGLFHRRPQRNLLLITLTARRLAPRRVP